MDTELTRTPTKVYVIAVKGLPDVFSIVLTDEHSCQLI